MSGGWSSRSLFMTWWGPRRKYGRWTQIRKSSRRKATWCGRKACGRSFAWISQVAESCGRAPIIGSLRAMAGVAWASCALAIVSRSARRFPIVENPVVWSDEQIALLGHLVGDGSYLTHQPLRYTTASEENSKFVTDSAIALGSHVSRHPGRGNWHQLVIAGNGNRWHAKGVGAG